MPDDFLDTLGRAASNETAWKLINTTEKAFRIGQYGMDLCILITGVAVWKIKNSTLSLTVAIGICIFVRRGVGALKFWRDLGWMLQKDDAGRRNIYFKSTRNQTVNIPLQAGTELLELQDLTDLVIAGERVFVKRQSQSNAVSAPTDEVEVDLNAKSIASALGAPASVQVKCQEDDFYLGGCGKQVFLLINHAISAYWFFVEVPGFGRRLPPVFSTINRYSWVLAMGCDCAEQWSRRDETQLYADRHNGDTSDMPQRFKVGKHPYGKMGSTSEFFLAVFEVVLAGVAPDWMAKVVGMWTGAYFLIGTWMMTNTNSWTGFGAKTR
jgi:hypothetical protein